jgi:hypothetical protein
MIAFGSGDPTKIICSALIAGRSTPCYRSCPRSPRRQKARREILTFAFLAVQPRDFDISPYFEIVKPTIVHGFDYTALHWADKPLRVAGEFRCFQKRSSRRRLFLKRLTRSAASGWE